MTPVTCFANRKVALFGLGGSGFATARALVAGGALVTAWDDNAVARARAGNAGIEVLDLARADWSTFQSLVLTPGVPLTDPKPHWTVDRAREHGVEIIGDIELFCRERAHVAPGSPFVAITGTNGKSTTTALIAHLFRENGFDVQMGGNIGTPALYLEPPAVGRIHVLEVSSFQIDLAPSLDPSVGVLVNLTPDHIDRHGTMERYAAVKERLVNSSQCALVSVDDPWCWSIGARRSETYLGDPNRASFPVSARMRLPQGVFVEGTQIVSTIRGGEDEIICDLSGIASLRGLHNAQNAAFASACALMWKLTAAEIASAMRSFPGLPHRMEETGRIGHILFINDSKATNADAAEKALLSFRNIFWIAGGQMKEGGIRPLLPLMDRVAKVYLIGASMDAFAHSLADRTPFVRCGTLDAAVVLAAEDAGESRESEAVVLLSPACASYDQFANYEARGDAFRALSAKLIAATGAAQPGRG